MIRCCECQQFIKLGSGDYYEFTPYGDYGDLEPKEEFIHIACWEKLDYEQQKLRCGLMYNRGSIPDITELTKEEK